jgi:predicted kinase
MPPTGSDSTTLIVLRGNSASGKSSVAAGIRERSGRGIAIVGQDNLRRIVLREHDKPNAANIGLIDLTARYALDHGFHVIVEGILYASHYGDMLTALCADHLGATRLYYLHVPFEETLRRHATKPEAAQYGEAEMATWYRELDLLPKCIEQIVSAETSLTDIVDRVMRDIGLASQPATRITLPILSRGGWPGLHCWPKGDAGAEQITVTSNTAASRSSGVPSGPSAAWPGARFPWPCANFGREGRN